MDIFWVYIQPWACVWHSRVPSIPWSPSKPLFLQEFPPQPLPFHAFKFDYYLLCLSPLLQEALGGTRLYMLSNLLLGKLLQPNRVLKQRSASTLIKMHKNIFRTRSILFSSLHLLTTKTSKLPQEHWQWLVLTWGVGNGRQANSSKCSSLILH